MSIFYQPGIHEGEYYLDAEESRHCAKVLRHRTGDRITVVDGRGTYYEAVVTEAHPKRCRFEVVQRNEEPSRDYAIHLLIAPTKNTDRMEWMVEKLTEIGIDSIQWVQCRHSERSGLKLDRLLRKAISAMKQSERALLPQLRPVIPLTTWRQDTSQDCQKFIAHLSEEPPIELFTACQAKQVYYMLVGPEGDFTEEEISWATAQGFQPVRLGKYRLRTETAGLIACHTLHLVNLR